jgi:transcriptional regulator with XRE-family HTH domain
MEELPKHIRLLRHEKGWSQGDFAKRLGLSVPAFSKMEAGVTDITLSRLQQMALILDMSLMKLLQYDDGSATNQSAQLDIARETIRLQNAHILDLQKQVIILHEEVRRLYKEAELKL